FEEIRRFKSLLKLLRTRYLAVVLDFHAFGIVDDDGEITLLRQNGLDVQNRPQKDERKHRKGDAAERNQGNRKLVARDAAVRVVRAGSCSNDEKDEQRPRT